jgi:uncharacterized protein YbaR (Trm112 family)
MDDTLVCPICKNKLNNIKLSNKFLHAIDKTSDYVVRRCIRGMNHFLTFYVDENTWQVDFLKISLNPKYSRYIEIDFVNQKCRIACLKDSKPEYIEIDKMLYPDFPHLTKLKEKVSLFVVFS